MSEEKKYNKIMVKKEMSIEEAETIIDDMYQDKNKVISEGNTIFVDKIGTVEYTNLEFASVRALREIQSLRRTIEKLQKENDDLNEICLDLQLAYNKLKEEYELLKGENDG